MLRDEDDDEDIVCTINKCSTFKTEKITTTPVDNNRDKECSYEKEIPLHTWTLHGHISCHILGVDLFLFTCPIGFFVILLVYDFPNQALFITKAPYIVIHNFNFVFESHLSFWECGVPVFPD